MFKKLIFVYIFILSNVNLYANSLGFFIYKQNYFSLPELTYSYKEDYNISTTYSSSSNFITGLSYTNSNISYKLLYYIDHIYNANMIYSNYSKDKNNDYALNNQTLTIKYNQAPILAISLEYKLLSIENLDLKIGVSFILSKSDYTISDIINYKKNETQTVVESIDYKEGQFVKEDLLTNSNNNCFIYNKSDNLVYLYNEEQNNYEILEGSVHCSSYKTDHVITNVQNHTDKNNTYYNINYSPYISLDMGIFQNLYLYVRLGISIYNSNVIEYTNEYMSLNVNSPKHSNDFTLGLVYYIDY